MQQVCDDLWDCSLQSTSGSSHKEMRGFLDFMLENCSDFVEWRSDLGAPLKNQIILFGRKLRFIRSIYDFSARRCCHQQKLEEFWSCIQGAMNYAVCLSILDCTNSEGERLVVRNIKPYTHSLLIIKMCFEVLLSSDASLSEQFEFREIVDGLFNFHIEDLVMKHHFEKLRDGLLCLTTFLMSQPDEIGGELLTRVRNVISDVEASVSAAHGGDFGDETVLVGLRVEIDEVMAEIREVHVCRPSFEFPLTRGIGFIDCLLGDLREIVNSKASSIPFAMDNIMCIREELLSIRPFLINAEEMKNGQIEVKDLYKRIRDAAYQAEHVVKSCLIVDTQIWHDMISLSRVTEEIKAIRIEVGRVTALGACKVHFTKNEYHSVPPVHPRQANTSRTKEIFVGFEDEMQGVIDRLTRGTTQLDVISIVGMPGQGKTTLAKKVYTHPSVTYHFHASAWCYVSQVYQPEQLLLDILSDVTGIDSHTPKACLDELAEKVWRSLKGKRFVIVLDDIWDVGAWEGIKRSLPDDGNGSRVVFTSRIHRVVMQANPNCSPLSIRFLNDEESWELLQKRLFYIEGCPSELAEIGKKIAVKCKGLPLSVVLVTGILAGKDKSLDCWMEIAETMGSFITGTDLVELSYKHLPDCLRPCFLYFGAFPEDKIIRVQKLIHLWMGEGFVSRNDVKKYDERAWEYLMDLIDRSLVIVATRSSTGEVKSCCVHDIVRDFCLTKSKEERFLHKIQAGDHHPKNYDQYRVCIDICQWQQFIDSRLSGSYVHSFLIFGTSEFWARTRSSGLANFFFGFKFLHVLDMECIHINDNFPVEITMFHLRYFAVSCRAYYHTSSIANLLNLETLIVKTEHPIPLPDAIWTVKTFRHIDFHCLAFKNLNIDECCQLHNVGSFSTATLTSEKDAIELSRRLPHLRKLKCKLKKERDSENPIQMATLSCFSELESLTVSNFADLYRDPYPSLDFATTLKKLTLDFCSLRTSSVSTIGKLPKLEVLKLRHSTFFQRRWDLEDGEFLNLKFLELSEVQLQHWNDCEEPFPCLERLVLKHCIILEEIPPNFGYIMPLKRMDVYLCGKASSSARKIVDMQMEMGNYELELHIQD